MPPLTPGQSLIVCRDMRGTILRKGFLIFFCHASAPRPAPERANVFVYSLRLKGKYVGVHGSLNTWDQTQLSIIIRIQSTQP